MVLEKSLDAGQRRHKAVRKIRKRRVSDNDEQCCAMIDYRLAFVWGIAYATVMRERDPAALTYVRKPFLVRCVVDEMICVPLNLKPRIL